MSEPLLRVSGLEKTFVTGRGRRSHRVPAVRNAGFSVPAGSTLGLVGESGSGKSTLGRLLLGLVPADAGEIWFDGQDLRTLGKREFRQRRRDLQMVFQDPYASLDPTKTVGASVGEPLKIFEKLTGAAQAERVEHLLGRVGLDASFAGRYPSEMSGGQRQRVALARALALSPKLVVADEAVSALDVSTQAEVINLMLRLQRESDLTYVFISHNLAVVRHVATQIAVMYLGVIVEIGPAEEVYERPRHPYTQALLAAVPVPDPEARRQPEIVLPEPGPAATGASDGGVEGVVAVPSEQGCPFVPRCPFAMDVCRSVTPPAVPVGPAHQAACHLVGDDAR